MNERTRLRGNHPSRWRASLQSSQYAAFRRWASSERAHKTLCLDRARDLACQILFDSPTVRGAHFEHRRRFGGRRRIERPGISRFYAGLIPVRVPSPWGDD